MAFINEEAKEINCKIVYCGPGVAGKRTNMQALCGWAVSQTKGNLFYDLATKNALKLFFNFVPSKKYRVDGFKLRYHLYTLSGDVFFNSDRQLLLKGVDGLIFVADSQRERRTDNIESIQNLEDNLKSHNYYLMKIPYALQLNKRDLPNILSIDELKKDLMRKDEPVFDAVASKGIGVYEPFTSVATQIWQVIQDKYPVKTSG